jgi:predicted  nucleic acid-binding Zn-ribbon protein
MSNEPKTNYSVVRNVKHTTGQVSLCQRHNERENESYYNTDVRDDRAHLNVHFHQNFRADGTVETYQETIDRLLAERTIVKYNFKANKSPIIDELVFDVNSEYFDERGSYEYAKRFYEEAYRLAIKEIGGEQYILSAVLHADEWNKGASEKLGHDVWHYHLHVVYVPVVEGKEIKYTARAGKELQGKVKEVITQINHTDKWPYIKGKRGNYNEYSALQDRFFAGMIAAGFDGFERGEVGSKREHLDVLSYKIQQETKRLAEAEREAAKAEAKLTKTEQAIEKKTAQSKQLDEKISVKKSQAATLAEIDAIGKPIPIVGGYTVPEDDMKKLKSWSRQIYKAQEQMGNLTRDMDALKVEISAVKRERDDAKRESGHWYREFKALEAEVKPFIEAIRKFPQKMLELVKSLFPPVKQQEQVREIQPQRKKNHDIGR